MKLSISNIAWDKHQDSAVIEHLKKHHFQGIEIAPTRIIPHAPYDHIDTAQHYAQSILEEHHLEISSIQSIWYGQSENLFHSASERAKLLLYTQKAIDFASAINCKNVVFGSPKNRNKSDDASIDDDASEFFKILGDYAARQNTTLALEPNPVLYGTNFINTTEQAFEYVKTINSKGLKVNVDLGTMIANEETADIISSHLKWINHIHISEPFLNPLEKRALHQEIITRLKHHMYQGFLSIEMKKSDTLTPVLNAIEYVSSLL